MRQRTLSAIIVVLFAIVPMVLGTWALLLLFLFVILQGARELARAFSSQFATSLHPLSISLPALVPLGTVMLLPTRSTILAATLVTVLLALTLQVWQNPSRSSLERATFSSFAALYLSIPLASALLLRSLEGAVHVSWLTRLAAFVDHEDTSLGLAWFAWVLSVTWLTDTTAYLIGLRYGRRRLAPRLSPGKTREGAVSGVLMGTIIGSVGTVLFGLPMSVWFGALAGAIVALIGELGDLAESALKRCLSIKDFGQLIPGHGGILDRIDALLATIPATLLLATLLGGGAGT